MKNFVSFAYLSLLLIVGCSSDRKSLSSDAVNQSKYISIDTILNAGGKMLLFLNLDEEKYFLKWGSGTYSNISKDTLHSLPDGKVKMQWHSKDAIALRQGCGTSCFYAYILPLKDQASEAFYMYPLAYDTVNNLIAYNGDNNESLVIVENYLTRQKQHIDRMFLRGPFPGYAIDSIAFLSDRRQLFLKWKDEEEENQSEILKIEL